MYRISLCFIWLHMLAYEGYAFNAEQLAAQSVKIISYLLAHNPGTFTLWIYDVSRTSTEKDPIHQVLVHPQMRDIPRMVVTPKYSTKVLIQPSIMVINCGTNMRRLDDNFFIHVDIRTKLLVFLDTNSERKVDQVADSLSDVNLFNVLFLSTTHDYVFHNMVVKGKFKFQAYSSHLPLRMTFFDHMRSVEGLKFTASMLFSSSTTYYHKGDVSGPSVNWLRETSNYVNASYHLAIVNCLDINDLYECKKRRYWVDNAAVDLCLDFVTLLEYDPYYLDFVQPFSKRIIVPRGRHLDVLELFIQPFQSSVWITIVVLMVVCHLLMFIVPNIIRENPFLCAVCNISIFSGAYNRKEHILIASLSILFFFLLSAYETKFISFLVDAPYKTTPQNLDQLLKLGMKVNTNTKNLAMLHLSDDRFQTLFQYHVTTTANKTLDGINGYVYEQNDAFIAMSEPENWDQQTGKSRYVFMENTLKLMIGFNHFSYRNPFLPKFRYTQRVFVESGLWKRWLEQIIVVHHQGFLVGNALKADYGSMKSNLGMKDLIPAWAALALGFGIAIILFFEEVACSFARLRFMHFFPGRR